MASLHPRADFVRLIMTIAIALVYGITYLNRGAISGTPADPANIGDVQNVMVGGRRQGAGGGVGWGGVGWGGVGWGGRVDSGGDGPVIAASSRLDHRPHLAPLVPQPIAALHCRRACCSALPSS